MHKEGIIHRDISPDNIMVDNDGNFKLLDFGAARGYSEENAATMSVILKKSYAPEEQFRSKGIQGPWTDVYALGAAIYELITGQTPPASIDRLVEDEIIEIKKLAPALTKGQSDAIMTALAVRQKDRGQAAKTDDNIKSKENNNDTSDKGNAVFKKIPKKIYGIGIGIIVLLIAVVSVARSAGSKEPAEQEKRTESTLSSISRTSNNSETNTSVYESDESDEFDDIDDIDEIMQAHLDTISCDSASYFAYIEFTNKTDKDITILSKDIYLNGIPTDSPGKRNIGVVPAGSTIILSSYISLDVLISKGIDNVDSFEIWFYLGKNGSKLYRIEEKDLSITIDYLERVNANKMTFASNEEDADIEN